MKMPLKIRVQQLGGRIITKSQPGQIGLFGGFQKKKKILMSTSHEVFVKEFKVGSYII